jgi:hypothetical protein
MAAAAVSSQPGLPAGPPSDVSQPKAGKHNVDHDMEYFALEKTPDEPYHIG